ncbi:MAG TPA: hypothetical protein VK461_17110 [Acidimicrobiales bacterium]|nr:hypothetical protein [Acidimicrobiales bacterium]
MIVAWRGRLELLGLLVAIGVLVAAVGFHVFALAQVEPYTTALREVSLIENAALAVATVVCLLIVLLPRLAFSWPSSTPVGLAVTALIVTAVAAALVGVIGVVAAIGGISEVRLHDFEREVSTTTPEAWAYVALGIGTAIVAIVCVVYAIMGAAATVKSRRPEPGPPMPLPPPVS